MFESVFVGLLYGASVHDDRLLDGGSHRPVDHAVFIKIRDALCIEAALISIFPDMPDKLNKRFFINSVAHDVFVRPGGSIGLCERPMTRLDERPQGFRQLLGAAHGIGCWLSSGHRGQVKINNQWNMVAKLAPGVVIADFDA